MRPRTALVVSAVLAAALALPAAAQGRDPARGGWEGFPAGAWAHRRTVVRYGDAAISPTTADERETLREVATAHLVLRREKLVGTDWRLVSDARVERWAGALTGAHPLAPGSGEDLGWEEVVVEGRAHRCRKVRASGPAATEGPAPTVTRWLSEGGDLLKSESSGPGDMSTTLVVTRLAFAATVAGRTVPCRSYESVVRGAPAATTTVLWLSTAVPGGLVFSEARTGAVATGAVARTDLVDFGAPPAESSSPGAPPATLPR